MAFFKKKRGPPGPSKNEQKVRRGMEIERQERASGTLSSRYPGLKQLSIEADFYSEQGPLLEHRSLKFKPEDPLNTAIPCPGRCGRSNFYIDALLDDLTANGKRKAEETWICEEPLYTGAGNLCGCKMQFVLTIS